MGLTCHHEQELPILDHGKQNIWDLINETISDHYSFHILKNKNTQQI